MTTPQCDIGLRREAAAILRTVEEIVRIGFERSRVVMMNEAHSGLRRCVRTRLVGMRAVSAAHQVGCRLMAMEALTPDFAARGNAEGSAPPANRGYLAQPDFRNLVTHALTLGWRLIPYEHHEEPTQAEIEAAIERARAAGLVEPDGTPTSLMFDDPGRIERREVGQARNLAEAITDAPVLVWGGWGHIHKGGTIGASPTMATHFQQLTGIEPFSIDQTRTVQLDRPATDQDRELQAELALLAAQLDATGGTAGYLRDEDPNPDRRTDTTRDANLLSMHNTLE